MENNYVIIGSSAAGMAAAGKLRELDQKSRILCLSADKQMPYNRCLLADVLSGTKSDAEIRTKTQRFFDEKNIELVLNARVEELNAVDYRLRCVDGSAYAYDQLFIGTGKAASIPSIPGNQAAGVFTLYDLEDVLCIQAYSKQHVVRDVVVLGAGLTGLECADALSSHVSSVTVIERASHVLPHQIDREGAQFLKQLAEQRNINVLTSTAVVEICQRDGAVVGVTLDSGEHHACQVVVLATGAVIQSGFARDAGVVTTPLGIVVSDAMQTSHKHIYAGGDVCQVWHQVSKAPLNSSLWPDAVMQGLVAATNMVGQQRSYAGILPITSSTIFGATFVTCMPAFLPESVVQERSLSSKHYHVHYREKSGAQQLYGFVMVGALENLGALRKEMITNAR